LGGQLANTSPDSFPDYWTFDIEEVIFDDNHRVQYLAVKKNTDMKGFLLWLNEAIAEFYERQSTAMDSFKLIREIERCSTCNLPVSYCRCITVPQSYFQQIILASFTYTFARFIYDIFTEPVFKIWSFYKLIRALDKETRMIWLGCADVCRCKVVDVLIYFGFLTQERFYGEQRLRQLGEKVRDRVIAWPRVFVAAAAIATLLLFYRKRFGKLFQSQGAMIPLPVERANAYATGIPTYIETTSFPVSGKMETVSLDSLTETVAKNVVYCEFTSSAEGRYSCSRGRALAVKGNLFLINKHTVPEGISQLCVQVGKKSGRGVQEFTSARFNPISDMVSLEGTDCALVRFACIPPKADLVDYFLDAAPSGPFQARYVDRDENGVVQRYSVKVVRFARQIVESIGPVVAAFIQVSEPTVPGQCGMALVGSHGSNACIVGIHSFGNKAQLAGTMFVTRKELQELIERFEFSPGDAPPLLSSQSAQRRISSLHPKCTLNFSTLESLACMVVLPVHVLLIDHLLFLPFSIKSWWRVVSTKLNMDLP
jgi:hypothetical protein